MRAVVADMLHPVRSGRFSRWVGTYAKGPPVVEFCIHAANIFYLASFLGRDMLWLRALTCAGLVLGIVFFSCQATPMYGPTAWHAVFLLINGLQIARLVSERRQLRLTDEQMQFGESRFGELSRDELLCLLTRVTSEGTSGELALPATGTRPLDRDEKALRDLAFSHLTRQEILNLLTRRFWHSLRRKKLARWRWQRQHDRRIPAGRAGRDEARDIAAM